MKRHTQTILELLRQLISDGETMPLSQLFPKEYVDKQSLAKWVAGINALNHLLGENNPWYARLSKITPDDQYISAKRGVVGLLQGIEQVIEKGWITTLENLVFASAFADLFDQAQYLESEGYWLAAGVLGRAVLEEHLRNWCDRANCLPSEARPQIRHFKDSLYKAKHLDKIGMLHVEAMASVGNAAAHNDSTLKKEAIKPFLADVQRFLAENPLP